MSSLRTVPQQEWRGFFDGMSKALVGTLAEIEVAALPLGDQIVVEWVPLLGITYDSKDDALDVVLKEMSHVIQHPREIVVDEAQGRLASVAVVDGDGARQVVRLKEPLRLKP